jgi:Gas vesicle synthesis protein GvpL/GvpF
MPGPNAVWVYAVTEGACPAGLNEIEGVGGGRVHTLAAAGLTAIAGNVPLAEFGEAALRRNLEDLAWLDATARAHHRVIEAVAGERPVVPMRLATVYRDDAGAAGALAERAGDLRVALDRIRAHKEWGIKVYSARPQRAPGASGSGPGQARGTGQTGGGTGHAAADQVAAGSGAAYLARRRRELSAHESARRDAVGSAEEIHARLARLADHSRLHPPQSPQLADDAAQMILNAAYLLADDRDADFAAAVSDLVARHPAVRLEVTGPWPPYSFAGLPEADPP